MPSDSDSESDDEIEYQGLSSAEIATANSTEREEGQKGSKSSTHYLGDKNRFDVRSEQRP